MRFAAITMPLLFAFGAPAEATELHVPAGSGVVITFDLPTQPAEHNGFFMFAGFTARNGTVVKTELFDEAGLLGQTIGDYVFPLFTDPTNFHSGQPYAVDIDYSRLADGAAGAKLVLTVTDAVRGGYIQFDTANLKGQGLGNSGTFPGYGAVITSVTPFAAAVPEPTTAWLASLGLPLVFGVSRARAKRH